MRVHYWREVANEPRVPVEERILFQDEHLIVVDKPHFLTVTPTGPWVEETLLRRLQKRLSLPDLAPLHRLDRLTAGLILFAVNPSERNAYHDLFRSHRILKVYEALAPPITNLSFPVKRRSRLVRGNPFFLSCESPGVANSETLIDVIDATGAFWRYDLRPVTGHKHQLRVHMAALGAPILNDPFYPHVLPAAPDDYSKPLKLLAREIQFRDPIKNIERSFRSALSLVR